LVKLTEFYLFIFFLQWGKYTYRLRFEAAKMRCTALSEMNSFSLTGRDSQQTSLFITNVFNDKV